MSALHAVHALRAVQAQQKLGPSPLELACYVLKPDLPPLQSQVLTSQYAVTHKGRKLSRWMTQPIAITAIASFQVESSLAVSYHRLEYAYNNRRPMPGGGRIDLPPIAHA